MFRLAGLKGESVVKVFLKSIAESLFDVLSYNCPSMVTM